MASQLKNFYETVNFLYSHACFHHVVFYQGVFTKQQIDSSTSAASPEHNGKDPRQTDTASSPATKNFRNSGTSASTPTTSSKEEASCLKMKTLPTPRKSLFFLKQIILRSFHRNRKCGLHSDL